MTEIKKTYVEEVLWTVGHYNIDHFILNLNYLEKTIEQVKKENEDYDLFCLKSEPSGIMNSGFALQITGRREETDEELKERKRQFEELAKLKEHQERWRYEQLKAKFEGEEEDS